jgi:hypothetical protein
MKHLSTDWWKRAALAAELATDRELLGALRDRLVALSAPCPANPTGDWQAARAIAARDLGITPFQLSGILRRRFPVSDQVAGKLGYRKVVRFERVE